MEWLTCIKETISYIENNLKESITLKDVANNVCISPYFLERGFSLMTGYGIGEYIRNRRLYLAALDLKNSDEKIIDIAFKYCYETPESFTKAFSRFHGVTPTQARDGAGIKGFLPLTINIKIKGGDEMNYKIKTLQSFKVVGFEKEFDIENSYEMIPKFWDEIFTNVDKQTLSKYGIGEYGVCVDDLEGTKFRYLIAGKYDGGEVPAGMSVYELPKQEWAIFECVGPCPETLQKINTQIFHEWLPGNPDYEFCGKANIEWYSDSDNTSSDYHSQIWIPVKKRDK